MRAKRALRVAVLLGICHGGPAGANDGSFGGSAAELIPVRSTVVIMRDEDIRFESRGGAWSVTATYHFENPSDAPVPLQMGFPESRCDPNGNVDCVGTGEFMNLKTLVRGVEVKQRRGRVSPKAASWWRQLGEVYLYDVTFAPREKVEIVHHYEVDQSVGVEGDDIYYVTTTGRLWGAPIGRARFTIVMETRPWGIWYDKPFQLLSYTEKKKSGTEIVLETRDWIPHNDFALTTYRANASSVQWLGCPSFEHEDSFVRRLDAATLRRCRNLPYARHGRPFRDRDLHRFFYQRRLKPHRDLEQRGTHVQFVENPDFDEDMIDSDDRRLIRAIDDELKRRAQK